MKVIVAVLSVAMLGACASQGSGESARLAREYRAGRITSAQYNTKMRALLRRQAAWREQDAARHGA